MRIKNTTAKINKLITWIDGFPLWWIFFLLFAVVFSLFPVLSEGSVFEYHDQLDEYMMNTVLTARHLGEGLQVLPEMMGGINASSLRDCCSYRCTVYFRSSGRLFCSMPYPLRRPFWECISV